MTTPTPVASITGHTDKVTGPALCSGARAITAELPAGTELDSMTSTELVEVLRRLDLAPTPNGSTSRRAPRSAPTPPGTPAAKALS